MARVLICKKTRLYVEIGDEKPTKELIDKLKKKYRVGEYYSPELNFFNRSPIRKNRGKDY